MTSSDMFDESVANEGDPVEAHKRKVQACWFPMSAGIRKVGGREEPPREGAPWLEWFCGMVREFAWFVPPGDANLAGEIAASLKSAPAPSAAAGVAVPEDVRKVSELWRSQYGLGTEARTVADFILSLPTAAGASQPEPAAQQQPQAAEPDAELQRLLERLGRDDYATVVWCETVEKLFNALVRKAGAK